MPNYVGLGQQGFYEPYQFLGQMLAQRADREQRGKQFGQEMGFRQTERGDRLTQQQFENTRQTKADELAQKLGFLNLDQGALALQQSKLAADREKGMANLDFSSFDQLPQAVPPGFQGPPAPGAQANFHQRWDAQPPQVQNAAKAYAHAHNIPVMQLPQLFLQQAAAQTGQQFLPILPPGFTPTTAKTGKDGLEINAINSNIGGAEGGAQAPQAPPGHTWVRNPATGEFSLVKSENPAPDELLRLQSLDTLESQLKLAEENAAKVGAPLGATSEIPFLGAAVRGGTYLLNPEKFKAMKAYKANEAALPMDIWRGVMGANTRMNEETMHEIGHMIPSLSDSQETRKALFDQLHRQIKEARGSAVDVANRGGKEMRSFNTPDYLSGAQSHAGAAPQQAPSGPLKFRSEQEYVLAGSPKGAYILQPTGLYRKVKD